MFTNLPQSIKQQVLCYLEANDFVAAKALYQQCLDKMNNNHFQEDAQLTVSTLN